MTTTYEALIAHTARTLALGEVAGLLSWDQETVMPRAGAAQRAEHAAAVQEARHCRDADPRVADWLAELAAAPLPDAARRNVDLIARRHRRATRIPTALSIEIARKTSVAHGIWAAARAANRFADFAPYLAEIIALRQEEARHLADDGVPLYDALLDDYEPGMTSATLTPIFDSLRGPLTDLRATLAAAPRRIAPLSGHFPKSAQLALTARLAEVFRYDMNAGRIDLAVHPFSSGSGGDVRITTRVDEAEPLGSIYSTIHEMGHAVYEQNIAPGARLTPIGTHASMAVHESQSRLFENQIGRSRAFCEWLFPAMRGHFGDFGIADADGLYAALNRVETGFIRTEADEVHYNLHIILRYDLERDLIEGRLDVADLEGEWNRRFEADFGRKVPDAARGVLQDVHWSEGYFGYFPTYALGNIYAAELFAALRRDLGDIDAAIARGDLGDIVGWLNRSIHQPGNALEPRDLIARAIGHDPAEAPLLGYLRDKFATLYGV